MLYGMVWYGSRSSTFHPQSGSGCIEQRSRPIYHAEFMSADTTGKLQEWWRNLSQLGTVCVRGRVWTAAHPTTMGVYGLPQDGGQWYGVTLRGYQQEHLLFRGRLRTPTERRSFTCLLACSFACSLLHPLHETPTQRFFTCLKFEQYIKTLYHTYNIV